MGQTGWGRQGLIARVSDPFAFGLRDVERVPQAAEGFILYGENAFDYLDFFAKEFDIFINPYAGLLTDRVLLET